MSADSFARALREKARLEKFAHDDHGRPVAFWGGVGFCAFSDEELRRNLLAVADMIDGKGDAMASIGGFRVIDKKTGKDADAKRIAKEEDWASTLCWCSTVWFAVDQFGDPLMVDACGRFEYAPDGRFEVVAI